MEAILKDPSARETFLLAQFSSVAALADMMLGHLAEAGLEDAKPMKSMLELQLTNVEMVLGVDVPRMTT